MELTSLESLATAEVGHGLHRVAVVRDEYDKGGMALLPSLDLEREVEGRPAPSKRRRQHAQEPDQPGPRLLRRIVDEARVQPERTLFRNHRVPARPMSTGRSDPSKAASAAMGPRGRARGRARSSSAFRTECRRTAALPPRRPRLRVRATRLRRPCRSAQWTGVRASPRRRLPRGGERRARARARPLRARSRTGSDPPSAGL